MKRSKSSYMKESSMRVNNTFRFITECFWKNHCRDSLCQTSSVVFQIFLRFFFLARSLIDKCQIVTESCKSNVSKSVWKPFKSPLSLRKWKCFGEASLFKLHYLHFNYHLLSQKLFSLWKILPYLQPWIILVLSENFVKFIKKKCIFKTSITVFHNRNLPTGK